MTTYHRSGDMPRWHSTFAAAADVRTATVHARGVLDLFTVDLLRGAIDVLTIAGCTEVTLDFSGVETVDRAAAWCIAETSCAMTSRQGRLTIVNARDAVQLSLGELNRLDRHGGGG